MCCDSAQAFSHDQARQLPWSVCLCVTACSQLNDNFVGPWAKLGKIQNDSIVQTFITVSGGWFGIFSVIFI